MKSQVIHTNSPLESMMALVCPLPALISFDLIRVWINLSVGQSVSMLCVVWVCNCKSQMTATIRNK